MSTLSILLVIAVAGVLFAGLFNMLKGGSANRSQQFMRWRVGLQFIAVIALMLGLWLSQRGS